MRARVGIERWPIRGQFRTAHGGKNRAVVVVVELEERGVVGRGESVPYPRYGESPDGVCRQVTKGCRRLGDDLTRKRLPEVLGPGAARNALDCALWDLRSRQECKPVWALSGMRAAPAPLETMRTVSVGTTEEMESAANELPDASVIKVKVDGGRDLERIAAVHRAKPNARLVVDANEAWSPEQCEAWLPALPELGVEVLEQPLPAASDSALKSMRAAVLLCADESFHDRGSLEDVQDRYDMVNVKLDKTGGLTEALACAEGARRSGMRIMVGCMVCTSLAVEPALLLAQGAGFVDLDGPLLLERDRGGVVRDHAGSMVYPCPEVWGGGYSV